jgi:hypothetical protein
MSGRAILAITSHGNAPYLMAARLAAAMGKTSVVIPLYYGDVQRRIMREELGSDLDYIYLSTVLGDLMRPLLFDQSDRRTFADFASALADDRNTSGLAAVEAGLNDFLAAGIPAENLADGSRRTFKLDDFELALNMAQPLLTPQLRQVYIFTGLLSRIYGTLPPGVEDDASIAMVKQMLSFAAKWARCEAACGLRFVPRIHACSYDPTPLPGVLAIPPLAVKRPSADVVAEPGVLFSPSGTGTDADKLVHLAGKLGGNPHAYVLAGGQVEKQFLSAGALATSGSAYADSKITWVAARGGWGTLWECLMQEKPAVLVRTTFVEDPEMGHTQLSMSRLGLAKIYDGAVDEVPSAAEIDSIRRRIQAERDDDRLAFGALADDGYAYLAEQILNNVN